MNGDRSKSGETFKKGEIQRVETKMKVDYLDTKSETSEDLERSAVHESSHAYTVWRCGGIIHNVTLVGPVKSSETMPVPRYCEYASMDYSRVQSAILLDAKVALAPAVNEELTGKTISFGSLNDVREFMEKLAREDSKIQEMKRDARRLLKSLDADWEKPILKFVEKYKLDIEKIISKPRAQEAISKLAKKLLDQGHVNGYEAAAVFEEACGILPEGVQPAKYHSKNSKIEHLPGALKFLGELIQIGLNALRSYREKNEEEEEIVDQIAAKLVELIFHVNGEFSKF